MPFTTVVFAGTKLSGIGFFSPVLNIIVIAAGSSACSSCSAGTYSIQSGGLLSQAVMCSLLVGHKIFVDIARAKGITSRMYAHSCILFSPFFLVKLIFSKQYRVQTSPGLAATTSNRRVPRHSLLH
jgi:hypothetical protein